MIDRFGRNIDYIHISLTDKCNLRCMYCMPSDMKFDKNYINNDLSFDDYKFIIKSMSQLGVTKIRFTGGEPLLYPNLNELILFAKTQCNIDDICITTNGIGLYEVAHKLKKSGLTKVNINLNSLKEYKYKSITRGGSLKEVLKSITSCLKIGLEVKINCVIINEFNDDELYDFMAMAKYHLIDVRFIELMPLGEAKRLYKRGYFNLNEIIEKIDGLDRVDYGEKTTAKYYKFDGSKGRIGIITPVSCSFCDSCNRIRFTSRGTIKLCLNSEEEIDIKKYLQKPLMFRETMKEIILKKS